ncbi:acetoacetate decarboxylase family protein [Williamsia sp. CHRR-6]|uniref:acetoacetate decarboxylase family protein n=1 Tax=Williamsia sp. CHRR-6 TaxID=2835871 RepID=UPI001BDB5737|nr:acetoacetate decarboxylase family protein [Williamsia sp. CHRR-6]MBT0567699.1 acetoacetate decarboxylase family protein [Williamsia sp. CHRR-6]
MTNTTSELRWRRLPVTVPEAQLSPEMDAQLPATGSPAPWRLAGRGVHWAAKAHRSDRSLLPPSVRSGAIPLRRMGFAVRYSHTPVGTYNELGAAIVYLRYGLVRVHIPFLPVDSAATTRGGRENWSLPKTLATFTGDPDAESTFTATGPDWSVSMTTGPASAARPIRIPAVAGFGPVAALASALVGIEQVDGDGRRGLAAIERLPELKLSMAGARVTVETSGSPALQQLFPSGTYRGGTVTYDDLHLGAARIRA